MEKIEKVKSELKQLENDIILMKEELIKKRDLLYKLCEHEWVRNRSNSLYAESYYVCKHCGKIE